MFRLIIRPFRTGLCLNNDAKPSTVIIRAQCRPWLKVTKGRFVNNPRLFVYANMCIYISLVLVCLVSEGETCNIATVTKLFMYSRFFAENPLHALIFPRWEFSHFENAIPRFRSFARYILVVYFPEGKKYSVWISLNTFLCFSRGTPPLSGYRDKREIVSFCVPRSFLHSLDGQMECRNERIKPHSADKRALFILKNYCDRRSTFRPFFSPQFSIRTRALRIPSPFTLIVCLVYLV